jgi:hemoglobin
MTESLYDRIGGEAAVRATVSKLYHKIQNDAQVGKFFKDIDMERLERSQVAFVTHAFGGPNSYNGADLRTAHANSVKNGLNDTHFMIVQNHLRSAMAELGVDNLLIEDAMRIVSSTRKDVLNK